MCLSFSCGARAALLVALLAPAALFAAQFTLSPPRVHLGPGRAAETIQLGNKESRPVSFEVALKRWRMDAQGRWVLEPSDELIVHPQIVTIPPRGRAMVRAGTLAPAVDEEQAYRIELQELPAERGEKAGSALTLLTRISVPVFVQVRNPSVSFALAAPALRPGELSLRLDNTGNAYLPPQDGKLRLRDGRGKIVREGTLAVGYVLSGARLFLSQALPSGLCGVVARIELELPESDAVNAVEVPQGARRCER